MLWSSLQFAQQLFLLSITNPVKPFRSLFKVGIIIIIIIIIILPPVPKSSKKFVLM